VARTAVPLVCLVSQEIFTAVRRCKCLSSLQPPASHSYPIPPPTSPSILFNLSTHCFPALQPPHMPTFISPVCLITPPSLSTPFSLQMSYNIVTPFPHVPLWCLVSQEIFTEARRWECPIRSRVTAAGAWGSGSSAPATISESCFCRDERSASPGTGTTNE
jgi:hypothetical protein